jgi:heme exporter protein C
MASPTSHTAKVPPGKVANAASAPAKPLSFTLLVAAAVAAGGFLWLPFLIARTPIEPVMGPIQKIFYFHVPSAWLLMLSTLVAGAASLKYLFRGSPGADRAALVSAELGALFGIAALVTGPLWGRVAWGKYWTWDARQTSTLLLWLVLMAYLLARKYGGPAAKKLAAALALFAAADVPLVYVSVRVWRTLHPDNSVVPTLDPAMRPAFYTSLLFFTLLWGVLYAFRLRLEELRGALVDLQVAVEDAEESIT